MMNRLPTEERMADLPFDEWMRRFVAAWYSSTTHEEVADRMRMMVEDVGIVADHYGLSGASTNLAN